MITGARSAHQKKMQKKCRKCKKCSFSWKLREFSRKFALKFWEEPRTLGLGFFFSLNAKIFKRFQVARGSYDVLLPRELRWRFLKVACIFLKILTFLIFFLHFLEGPFNSSVHYAKKISTLSASVNLWLSALHEPFDLLHFLFIFSGAESSLVRISCILCLCLKKEKKTDRLRHKN